MKKDPVSFFLLSYLVCNQIWLNHLRDDGHFSYITKLKKKKTKKPLILIAKEKELNL
jgi:hypothetical protein